MASKRRSNVTHRLSVRTSVAEYEAVREYCRAKDITMANHIRKMLGWPEEERGVARDRVGEMEQCQTPQAVLEGAKQKQHIQPGSQI